MNDALKIIAEKYVLKPSLLVEGVSFYDAVTPAVAFRHYIIEYGNRLICISQKDKFDEQYLGKIVSVLKDKFEHVSALKHINMIFSGNLGVPGFDALVVLGSDAHAQFKHDIPSIHPITYVVFPCHHSEFTESDTVEDIRYLRTKVIPTLVWDRKISPRVWLWFDISNVGKTHTNKLEISSYEFLVELLNHRVGNNAGLIKVKNYTRQMIDINVDKKGIAAFGCSFNNFGSFEEVLWDWLVQ